MAGWIAWYAHGICKSAVLGLTDGMNFDNMNKYSSKATQPSGKAWDCNSLIIGSNPLVALTEDWIHLDPVLFYFIGNDNRVKTRVHVCGQTCIFYFEEHKMMIIVNAFTARGERKI